MGKLWGGRFKKELDSDAKELSYSLHFDSRLVQYDIQTNLAHSAALHKAGILSEDEYKTIQSGLLTLSQDVKDDPALLSGSDEDIHSCVERLMTERYGDLGKKMHTGKSRNDQVATDVRLYVKEEATHIKTLLEQLLRGIFDLAEDNKQVLFPGFTHLQVAQPISLAHHLLAYFEKFQRDLKRVCQVVESADVSPLGSGALVGNNYDIDREFEASLLGFSSITQNSMDAVSDRDFMFEFCSMMTICMTHLSRFCEELIIWNSDLVGFVSIGDDFTTGSSLMPQKKNPDVAELIRGKSGRVLGHMVSLHHIVKSLPLTYNRDLQEDKELLFDSVDTLTVCLKSFIKMISTLAFNSGAIESVLNKGQILATDFADYLVRKGVPFRDSHHITGEVVLYAQSQNKQIQEMRLDEFQSISPVVDKDVYDILTFESSINAKKLVGGTARSQIDSQLKRIREEYQW